MHNYLLLFSTLFLYATMHLFHCTILGSSIVKSLLVLLLLQCQLSIPISYASLFPSGSHAIRSDLHKVFTLLWSSAVSWYGPGPIFTVAHPMGAVDHITPIRPLFHRPLRNIYMYVREWEWDRECLCQRLVKVVNDLRMNTEAKKLSV